MKQQKITPNLWFDNQAEEAAEFYISVFGEGSGITNITRYSEEGQEIHGRSAGSVMTVEFELAGYKFIGLNGGPHFTFTPAISFYVTYETEEEVDNIWRKLSGSGTTLMELDKYDWSEKYGWVQDKYGLTWQISLGKLEDVGQKITPSLMYVDENGRAEEAVNLYTSIFNNSDITGILHYGAGQNQPEGSVMHSQFSLNDEVFMAMDTSPEHADYTFNEAVSLHINCESQEEIDYIWENFSADTKAEQCGWLKDKFGVSWQVVPTALYQMLEDKDEEKVKRVTRAMLQMKKLDIKKLQEAYAGKI
ncbi:MAG: VOC family protein [Balneolaceae bacterium]